MRSVSVVGARPQFVKLGPVSRAMANFVGPAGSTLEDIIIHTGQHYDPGMSEIFFEQLQIPEPALDLEVGSGSHAIQTARMIEGLESALLRFEPDIVVIYGDTNSTLAGAVAASKLNIPIAHVEAGLRSFDRTMPEEVNRLVADHISDLLFAPTDTAIENLRNENLGDRARLVGDVMLDAVRFNSVLARDHSGILVSIDLEATDFGVATLHRAANTDSDRLRSLLEALNRVASTQYPVVFPVHPRTVARIDSNCPDWQPVAELKMLDPVSYLDMLRLVDMARVVLTDSGGLQKEAFFLGTPCVTLREETEWPETVTSGANVLAGSDPEKIVTVVERWKNHGDKDDLALAAEADRLFGDGRAAEKVVAGIADFLGG